MSTPAPQEPTADNRQFARMMRDMFVALVLEGFTNGEALVIIGQAMTAAIVASGTSHE